MTTVLSPLDWVAIIGYLAFIVTAGIRFGRYTRSTADFFFGGQRFSWWIVAISCVATLVGSYSFVLYSQTAFLYGMAAAQPYTNDWFVLPFFLLGWLPIIYYNRVQSIPEYFERRFDRPTRMMVLLLMLIYLEGYVGINLLTIGVFVRGLFGFDIVLSAAFVALLSGLYLHAGGQTSVLMTDVLQGILLLAAGIGVFAAGISYLGGFEAFWSGLPTEHQMPFAPFNSRPELNFVGDFWADAIVGTIAFYFINQGILMRFLSARSVRHGRWAMLSVVLLLMPLAVVSVSGAGWVGRSMQTYGMLPIEATTPAAEVAISADIFVIVARLVSLPGMFGLIVAAVLAALMSTLDTLVTAVSAVAVNDIWRLVRPGRKDAYYLSRARHTAILATLVGITLIPVFDNFESVYQALSHFISVITPPLVVVILLGVSWRSFDAVAARSTLIIGSLAILLSLFVPDLITPVAHGISPSSGYSYIRALFGLLVSLVVAIGSTVLRSPHPTPSLGLTIWSLDAAILRFKGTAANRRASGSVGNLTLYLHGPKPSSDELVSITPAEVTLPEDVLSMLSIEPGDLVQVADQRWWLGGLRSVRAVVVAGDVDDKQVAMSREAADQGALLPEHPVRVEALL